MNDRKVRRIRKKRIPWKAFIATAFLLAGVIVFFSGGRSKAVTVDVPSEQGTGSGWGDATNSTATSESSESKHVPSKTLTLDAAKKLAYATSVKLDDLNEKLEKKQAEYENKVKSAAIKREYVKHFHWRFLFSMDFPRDLTFEEIRETTYEPMEALEEVRETKKEIEALKLDLNEKVTDLYITIYKGRQSIEMDEERLLIAKDKKAKVAAMVATGEKNDADLKEAEQGVKDIESKIVSTISSTNAACKKLAKLVGFVDDYGNVSDPTLSDYKLLVPYTTDIINKLDRKDLKYLKQHTLDNDSEIYESRANKSLAYIDVTTVYSAISSNMKSGDMAIIAPYYNSVVAGKTINKTKLKQANKQFLKAIDRYWEGSYKIGIWPIRFSFAKTLFKGKADGSWYMQDDPNALYDTILEYYNTTTELKIAESDKEDEVEDAFNTYIGLRNTYTLLQEQRQDKEEGYKESGIQYRLGEIDAAEYNSILDAYEDLQLQELDALTTFSQNVNSFNRLTCGALDKILTGEDFGNEFGTQLVVANNISGASYYIVPKYETLVFDLGISVPEDFKYNITDFELWCDGTKVGERTASDSVITHLMTATANVEKVIIRLYDGDTFIADCEIDPGILQGELLIPAYEGTTELPNQVGSYELTENSDDTTVTFKLIPNAIENMKYFVVYDADGHALISEELCGVDEGIRYPKALEESIDQVVIKCYDADKNYLYDAKADIYARAIIKQTE
ncbi:MAG: hypothetical protein K6F37_00265 [Lachnospiraceae bacterium]|nr:hypothetical protein [Lachnospiraceae bacterium]